MLSEAEMLADQAAVFSDFPTETITIGGTDYACLVLDYKSGNDWAEAGGFISDVESMVAIERSSISASLPTQGDSCTFRNTALRVGKVDIDDDAASVVLALMKPTR